MSRSCIGHPVRSRPRLVVLRASLASLACRLFACYRGSYSCPTGQPTLPSVKPSLWPPDSPELLLNDSEESLRLFRELVPGATKDRECAQRKLVFHVVDLKPLVGGRGRLVSHFKLRNEAHDAARPHQSDDRGVVPYHDAAPACP